MSVASIANVPSDPESMLQWSFSHMAHHRDINRRILEVFHVQLPEFPLDPFDPVFMGDQHQTMHNNQNAVLSISGNDLLDVEWQDEAQKSVWIFLNFTEHLKAGNILGV